MPARLLLQYADRPSRVHLLEEGGSWSLGRDPGCELPVDDERVSRRHARLVHGADGWLPEDLRSKNGTTVGGRPAAPDRPLPAAGWISLGGLPVHFRVLSEEEARRERRRRAERWQDSLRRQRELDPSLGVEALLDRLLDSVLELSGAERGCVLLRDREGGLEAVALAGIEPHGLAADELDGSRGAIERALAERRPVTTSDARADTLLSGRPSVLASGIRALVCLPLAALDRILGVIYADSRRPGAHFEELDVEILEAIASHAALALAAARLHGELESLAARLGEEIPPLEPAARRGAGATRRLTWAGPREAHRPTGSD